MWSTRNVNIEESRKHHHFLSIKHSSSDRTGFSVGMDVSGVDITVEDDILKMLGSYKNNVKSFMSVLVGDWFSTQAETFVL